MFCGMTFGWSIYTTDIYRESQSSVGRVKKSWIAQAIAVTHVDSMTFFFLESSNQREQRRGSGDLKSNEGFCLYLIIENK